MLELSLLGFFKAIMPPSCLLYNILFYEHTSSYLFIYILMDIWVISKQPSLRPGHIIIRDRLHSNSLFHVWLSQCCFFQSGLSHWQLLQK